jgi:3-methyladenine DNA glycosylase AlkD
MKKLEKAGTAQNRKVYARHGVGKNQFGVSFGELRSLGKKLKGDTPLARALWKTGNQDARILATMVADPATFPEKTAESWVKQIRNYPLADEFAGGLVYETPYAQRIADISQRLTDLRLFTLRSLFIKRFWPPQTLTCSSDDQGTR